MPIASFCSAGSAFPCVQLQRPTPRDISHSGCAAEKMLLRQTVLCLSELNGRLRFSSISDKAMNSVLLD